MSDDRRARLEGELTLLGLQDKYDAATSAFREHPTPANKTRFKKAKYALADARRGQRLAEGRPDRTGAA